MGDRTRYRMLNCEGFGLLRAAQLRFIGSQHRALRIVTGFLSFDAYGFLRDFIFEKSYSAFTSATPVKRGFTASCVARGDGLGGDFPQRPWRDVIQFSEDLGHQRLQVLHAIADGLHDQHSHR